MFTITVVAIQNMNTEIYLIVLDILFLTAIVAKNNNGGTSQYGIIFHMLFCQYIEAYTLTPH